MWDCRHYFLKSHSPVVKATPEATQLFNLDDQGHVNLQQAAYVANKKLAQNNLHTSSFDNLDLSLLNCCLVYKKTLLDL